MPVRLRLCHSLPAPGGVPFRVLFVCIGNSCRSQMAEGFARAYGKDVMEAHSAGLAPAIMVAAGTRQSMSEKNIDLEAHFPKSLSEVSHLDFHCVVNISGIELPAEVEPPVRVWQVRDPIGGKPEVYRVVRDQIESLVMSLVVELRQKQQC